MTPTLGFLGQRCRHGGWCYCAFTGHLSLSNLKETGYFHMQSVLYICRWVIDGGNAVTVYVPADVFSTPRQRRTLHTNMITTRT